MLEACGTLDGIELEVWELLMAQVPKVPEEVPLEVPSVQNLLASTV